MLVHRDHMTHTRTHAHTHAHTHVHTHARTHTGTTQWTLSKMKLQKVNGYDSGGTLIFTNTEWLRGQDIFGYCLYILIDELVDGKNQLC